MRHKNAQRNNNSNWSNYITKGNEMRAYNKIGCESVSGRYKDKNVIHAELPK